MILLNAYGTHQRLLLQAALRTTGRILELGAGWYSTPLLHEVAAVQERFLLTHDNDPPWLEGVRRAELQEFWHEMTLLDRRQWSGRWGLVFVDHGPPPDLPRNEKGLLNALDRAQAVLDLMDRTDVFVLHDTQPEVRWEYDWDKVLPLFKFQHTDTTHEVWTTVCSNVIDVGRWQCS